MTRQLPCSQGDTTQHRVNLDALVRREDFEAAIDERPPASLIQGINVNELGPRQLTYTLLRKPDFQRETTDWTPEKVAEFVQSFLMGDLIPSVILWRAPTGNLFVIDGTHRLSALIAWVHDDYGDGRLSRGFYGNFIPQEQVEAADITRKLTAQKVGSYTEVLAAGQFPTVSPPERVRLAKNAATIAVSLQWVPGDAKLAEKAFLNINQKSTPINKTEMVLIESRRNPNAVAARALLRAGVGHKYW